MTKPTVTGRISKSEPNLQPIPVRTPEGKAIRDALIRDNPVPATDYSDIERRIVEWDH